MASHAAYFIAVSAYAVHAQALTIFDTNCTLPVRSYDYVQGPNVRGTIQIVWSCLATLVACTYTVLHMNLPEQRDGRDGGSEKYMLKAAHLEPPYAPLNLNEASALPCASAANSIKDNLRWWWKDNAPSMKWTLMTMLAPEFYTCRAIASLTTARKTKAALRTLPLLYHPTHGWTLTHAFFADMGGFAIRADTDRRPQDIIHLNGKSLFHLLRSDSGFGISPQSLLSEQEIQDRSKRDFFSKSLIMLQIGWFITNCSTRFSRKMPTTHLELFTFTTAIWSLVSYAILSKKPHSVKTPTILKSFTGNLSEDVKAILDNDCSTRLSTGVIYQPSLPRDDLVWEDSMKMLLYTDFGLAIGSLIFLTYDNAFHYPTAMDSKLWNYTIYIITGSTVSAILIVHFFNWLYKGDIDLRDRIVRRIAVSDFVFYGFARLVLAIEMIRFLLYLSPGYFLTTWADNVPHI